MKISRKLIQYFFKGSPFFSGGIVEAFLLSQTFNVNGSCNEPEEVTINTVEVSGDEVRRGNGTRNFDRHNAILSTSMKSHFRPFKQLFSER